MNAPEVEVRSFSQLGGENLKDAWYRISDAHHRCTKKHSTTILLRNFYVGISSWYGYVLDTLTGGNLLGTPALEACNIIESLVGTPPTKDIKIEITLEDVINKLDSMEKFFPNFLDCIGKTNESIATINERITVLEDNNIHDTQNHRIDELEETIETLNSTFTSLKSKKEKVYVGREQKFMYVPKVPKPKTHYELKIDKTFRTVKSNETPPRTSKIPIVTSCVLEEAFDDLDDLSLGDT